jgi:hypothetical protein
MKKLHLSLLSLIFATAINAQTITSLTPDSATQGSYSLAVEISGTNTSFSSGTSTYVYFNQGSSTYLGGYNTVVNSSTSITTYVDIPFSVNPGVYDLLLYNGNNNFSLNSAFTVLAGQLPEISYVDTNYATTGATLDVVISGTNTSFQSGSSTVWFSQGSTTIIPNFITIIDSVSLTANITLSPNYPAGFYDVNVYDNLDNTLTLPYGFFVGDSTIGIVSVTSDSTTYNLGDSSITIIITGSGTHFAQTGDTTIVWLGQVHRSEVPNIFPVRVHFISNTQISATFDFPTNIASGYYDIFTYNSIDGEMTKQWAVNLISTGITATNADKIKVYPNPVSGRMYIESTGENIADISLTSLNGQVVLKKAGTAKEAILNTESLESGVYILSVTDQSGATSYKKIVIE